MIELQVDEGILKHKGKRVRFGGFGITDGLKRSPCKYQFYKVIKIDEEGNVVLRGFRCKGLSVLPRHNFNQEYEVISSKDFRDLPEF